jgi:hypothetical protein
MRGKVLSGWVAISILAGCGGSKAVSTNAPASTAGGAATTKPVSTGAPTVTTVGSATTTAAAAATTAAGATPKLTGAADNDFCRYLVDLGTKDALGNLGIPENQTPEQLKKGTIEAQTLYSEMAKRAPAEIKAEMSAVSADFSRLAAIYASVGYDVVKLQEQLADPISSVSVEFTKIGGPDSATGGEKIGAYIENVCGLK